MNLSGSFNLQSTFLHQWPPNQLTCYDQKSGIIIQMEGHTLTPPNSQNGPKEAEASDSAPSHSPSQSPVRRPMPDCPETQYGLEIQVTSTEDGGMAPPPPHVWQVPVVEDMLWDGKSGLTEAVVMGPGWTILFYGWGMGCHVHAISSHQLGWQAGPTQCQCIEPAGRPVIDSSSHHWKMHQS